MGIEKAKPMELRKRIERALVPMVAELRGILTQYPTLLVLNYYLAKAHSARLYGTPMPDGFWPKFRYIWAILLSLQWKGYGGVNPEDLDFSEIDQRIETIFDLYRIGAIYDPGTTPGSRQEFLARMGLAIRVREPDVLGYPEQIKDWAVTRFAPFDDSFFRREFGNRSMEILSWVTGLVETVSDRVHSAITDGHKVGAELERLQDSSTDNPVDRDPAESDGERLRLEERAMECTNQLAQAHIFSLEELHRGLSANSGTLIDLLAIAAGSVSAEFRFPHDENPLELKCLVALPDGSYFFLDPANSYRLVEKALERQILAKDSFRDRYLRKRDKLTEEFVATTLRNICPDAEIRRNYFVEIGQFEKDILVRHGNTVILFECKNSRVRGFAGGGDDLIKYDNDFENSVQYAYDQALDVKQRIRNNEETIFYDAKGRESFRLRRSEISRFFIVCIAITPRGEFGTDLSYLLQKPHDEPYPVSISLFDFGTIAKYLHTPDQFLGYLSAREALHGRVMTGDELNFAGYFLKYGNLNLPEGMLVDDSHSSVFDRKWYAEKGIEVDEPVGGPVITSIERKGDKVIVEDPSGRHEITVPSDIREFVARPRGIPMTGAERNRPCACGSGKKAKKCCGLVQVG
jgi:hypothetical protein